MYMQKWIIIKCQFYVIIMWNVHVLSEMQWSENISTP